MNQKGSSIISVIMLSAFVASFSFYIMKLLTYSKIKQIRYETKSNLENIKLSVLTTLLDEKTWENTVKDSTNSSLACLQAPNYTCTKTDGGSILVIKSPLDPTTCDATNPCVVYDFSGTNGLNSMGESCPDYSASGNDDCPIKVNVNWSVDPSSCTTATNCFRPQIKIDVTFNYSPSSSFPYALNINKYNFTVTKAGVVDLMADLCSALGGTLDGSVCNNNTNEIIESSCTDMQGTYDPLTKSCTLPEFESGSCGDGYYLAGLNADDTKVCKSLSETVGICDSGDYLSGINTDGTRKCKPLPTMDKTKIGICANGKYLSGIDSTGKGICKSI